MKESKDISQLYWGAFLSWNGKRRAFAKHGRKKLMKISTFQANRYFDKWVKLQQINDNDKQRLRTYFLS